MAEEAAWKFVKEKGMDMVSILPTACIGKFFRPTLNFGAAVILSLINGLSQILVYFKFYLCALRK